MKTLLQLLVTVLPWKLRRILLNKLWGYSIHPTARIGLSYVFPKKLIMAEGARIGHLNVAIHLEQVVMEKDSMICQRNWITGFPLGDHTKFTRFPGRKPRLVIKEGSAITKQHHIDCTDTVTIGELTVLAGYGSQLLSHSTSIEHNDGACAPITIGHHCFVGTRCVLLPGAELPSHCVLGAGAVLNKRFSEQYALYGGVPARLLKKEPATHKFFSREYDPR